MRGTRFAELSAFVSVAEQQSFTKAAKQLGISTATLSQSIKSLEERLGVRLLNRTTRSVSLTPVGERLLGRLRPVLDDYEAALESINAFRDRPCGALRLTVPPPVAEFVLGPMLPRFMADYPDVRVEISVDPSLTDIVAERFDAGIRPGQRVERDMIAMRVAEMPVAIVGAPSYFARHGKPERPEDLREHKCIRLRFPSGALFHWRFQKKNKPIDVAVEGAATVDEGHLGVELAVGGAGLAYTLEAYAAPYLRDGRLVSVLQDWAPPPEVFYLYYPSRRQNPAALQAFIEFLKAGVKTRAAA
jgi:DNA-binding transcriptional LysR family regulator